jgi:hypothetical protein
VYRTGTGHFAGFVSTSGILRHNLAGATDTTALDAIEQMRSGPALAEPDRWVLAQIAAISPARAPPRDHAEQGRPRRADPGARDRAKLAQKDVAARARVLLAEVLDLMAAEFAAGCDPKTVAKLRGGADKDEEDEPDL